ncbi:MAG: aldehyde dehydrogenase family protein [Sphingosinicella sp.]|nr:aldehyde dehydrogenase family protein [Sphingosinicella sp.]
MKPASHWRGLADTLPRPSGHFIDGAYVQTGGETIEIIDPAHGSALSRTPDAGADIVDHAVGIASARCGEGIWSRCSPRARGEVLWKLADLIEAEAERFAVLESLCAGKPIRDTVMGEIPQAVAALRFFAELPDKLRGETTASDASVLHYVLRQPLGVVGAIVPWNFPINMAIWKAAPALAAGNSVVLKPAEQTPWTALLLAELFVRAGGPAGVFNVVLGRGDTAGQALATDPRVAKIAFTGSTRVGRLIHFYVSQSTLKAVALECGGKSPQIVMDDVADMEAAVDAAVFGAFGNAGQVCNAGSRLILHEAIHDAFMERFSEKIRDIRMGDPFDPDVTMGPLISGAAQKRVLEMIRLGRQEGARLAAGGERATELNGYFVAPTVFADADSSMAIAREEIFGPVVTVLRVSDAAEAVRVANASCYGLAAAIWSRDLDAVHRMAAAIEAGVVWVNCFDAGDMTQPFGGWKESGKGWDKGVDALMSYTQPKSVWIALGARP